MKLKIHGKQNVKRAIAAEEVIAVLWDFDQYLRGEHKHNDNQAAYDIRMELYELMNNYGVNLDDLVE